MRAIERKEGVVQQGVGRSPSRDDGRRTEQSASSSRAACGRSLDKHRDPRGRFCFHLVISYTFNQLAQVAPSLRSSVHVELRLIPVSNCNSGRYHLEQAAQCRDVLVEEGKDNLPYQPFVSRPTTHSSFCSSSAHPSGFSMTDDPHLGTNGVENCALVCLTWSSVTLQSN